MHSILIAMDLSGTQSSATSGLDSPQLLEQVERWLARPWVSAVINFAALALLTYGLAQATWRLLVPPATHIEAASLRPGESGGDYDLQALLSSNLFGQAAASAKSEVALDAIPVSSLSLVLTGVMVNPAGGVAVISADGGPETPFAVGQEISAGVTLHAVYSDRALIRRGGATESLMLKETSQELPTGAITNPSTASTRAANRIVQPSGQNNFTVNRQQLTQQMQTPEFLTQALMVPNAGGGFLVREIQPGSLYEKLGLRVGDVINAVNGQSVNTVEDVMRLYSQFGTAANVQVDVRRAGRNETLVYNIQ